MTLTGLEGRRVLVTGAGHGIGRATALRFAREGSLVSLLDVDGDAVAAAAAEAEAGRESVQPLVADVRDEESVAEAVSAAEKRWGGLDVVVANAAIEPREDDRADRLDLAVWTRIIETNLTGTFVTCKYGLRALLRSDCPNRSVIITVSPTGVRGNAPGEDAYSASKAGVIGLMRVLSTDYAPEGIRVNGVMPGFTDTRANTYIFEDQALLEETMRLIPLRRVGTPEDVAAMMAWVASDEASYATGAIFTVDGGMTAA
jgi:NAD(P)-dependent dehydrogenase (short-subunit alcohol dehydrogenase family)